MVVKFKEIFFVSVGRIRIIGKGLRVNLVYWYRVKKNLRVLFYKLEKFGCFENGIRNNWCLLLML